MLAEKKTLANVGVGVGVVAQVAGQAFLNQGGGMAVSGLAAFALGTVAFIWGLANYSQGKGYSGWFGCLGLLSILGLIILVVMPDKHKQS